MLNDSQCDCKKKQERATSNWMLSGPGDLVDRVLVIVQELNVQTRIICKRPEKTTQGSGSDDYGGSREGAQFPYLSLRP